MTSISSNWQHVSNRITGFISPTSGTVPHPTTTTPHKTPSKLNRAVLQYYVQLLDTNTNLRVSCKLNINLKQSTITLARVAPASTSTTNHTNTQPHFFPPYTTDTPIPLMCVKQLEWHTNEISRLVLIIVPVSNTDTVKSQLWDLVYATPEHRARCYHILIRKCSKDIVVKHLTGERQSHWLADDASKICMQCHAEFTLLKRRSHCRLCGKLYCHDCSNSTAFIDSLGYSQRPVRVCDTCYGTLKQQHDATAFVHPTLIAPSHTASTTDHTQHDNHKCVAFSALQRAEIPNYDNDSIRRDRYGFRLFSAIDSKQQRYEVTEQYTIWNTYMTNNTHLCLHSSATPGLLKYGIVPEYRAALWLHFSGANTMRAQHSDTYYTDLLSKTDTASIDGEIEKDLTRTFPYHVLFESVAGLTSLRRILIAYARHNSTVSYCQSLNFIAAMLLIVCQSNEADAFWLMCVVVEKLTAVASSSGQTMYYYQSDLAGAHIDQHVFDTLIKHHLPAVHSKLHNLQVPLLPLTINWFLCLFLNTLPIEPCMAVWDMLTIQTTEHMNVHVIFATSLMLLHLNQREILASTDFEQCLHSLKYQSFELGSRQFVDKLNSDWLHKVSYGTVMELRNQCSSPVLQQLVARQQHRRQRTLRKSMLLKPTEIVITDEDVPEAGERALDTSVQLEYADKFELNLIDEYYKMANTPQQAPPPPSQQYQSHPNTPNRSAVPSRIRTNNRQRVYSDVGDRSDPALNSQSPTVSELDATLEELVDLGRYISLSVKRWTSPGKFSVLSNKSKQSSVFSYDDVDITNEVLHDGLSDTDT